MKSKQIEFHPTLTSIRWKDFHKMFKDAGFSEVISYQGQDYDKPLDFGNSKDLLPCDFISHNATNH